MMARRFKEKKPRRISSGCHGEVRILVNTDAFGTYPPSIGKRRRILAE